jgi:hypothetical protein
MVPIAISLHLGTLKLINTTVVVVARVWLVLIKLLSKWGLFMVTSIIFSNIATVVLDFIHSIKPLNYDPHIYNIILAIISDS